MDEENNIKMIKTKYNGNSAENKIFISLKRKSKNINQFYYKRVQELIHDSDDVIGSIILLLVYGILTAFKNIYRLLPKAKY